jgi:glycine cleavage system regulatory protein
MKVVKMFKNKKVKELLIVAKKRTEERLNKRYKKNLVKELETQKIEYELQIAELNSEIKKLDNENERLHCKISLMKPAYLHAKSIVKKNRLVATDLAAEYEDAFLQMSASMQRMKEIEQRAINHENELLLEENQDRKILGLPEKRG